MTVRGAPRLAFVQLDLPGRLGLDDGRYLLRDADPERPAVVVVQTLGAAPARRRGQRRSRRADPGNSPPEVPLTRLTAIAPEGSDREELEASLGRLGRNAEAAEEAITDALRTINRLLRAHRIATQDPYGHEIARRAAVAVRVGFGTGDGLADGRWEQAIEVPPPIRRERRAGALRPQERLAAVLAGREPIDVCEPLLLRARADLDSERPREAALQLRAGLEALLAELPGRAGPDQESDLATLRDRREGTVAAARRCASRRPRRRAGPRACGDLADRRARPAPPPGTPPRVSSAQPSAARTADSSVDHVPIETDRRLGVVGGRALGDDRDSAAAPKRELGQSRDRKDLERGADAQQQVGAGTQLLRLPHRVLGQQLPEQDDIGLHLSRAARCRRANAVGIEQRLDLLELEASVAARAARGGDRAVHLDHLARSRLAVQSVDVLGDHRVQESPPLELGQGFVGGIGPLVRQSVEARPVEVPERARVTVEGVDRRHRHRIDLLPQPLAGGTEVGDPGWHRDPRPGQRNRRLDSRE